MEIKYRKRPIVIDSNDKNWQQNFVKATKSKFKHWKYEKEYRMVVNLEAAEIMQRNDLFFMPFCESLKLQAVYSGVNCELSAEDRSVLGERNIILVPTKKCRTSFSIINS